MTQQLGPIWTCTPRSGNYSRSVDLFSSVTSVITLSHWSSLTFKFRLFISPRTPLYGTISHVCTVLHSLAKNSLALLCVRNHLTCLYSSTRPGITMRIWPSHMSVQFYTAWPKTAWHYYAYLTISHVCTVLHGLALLGVCDHLTCLYSSTRPGRWTSTRILN